MQLPITFFNLDEDPKFVEALRYMLTQGAFAGDYLITFGRSLSFLHDEKFVTNLLGHPEKLAQYLVWRLHTACWAAHHCFHHVPGDFVECGVERAVTSEMICNYVDFAKSDRSFYLYDTFAGIPEKYLAENETHNYDTYSEKGLLQLVQQRFANFKNVKVVAGMLPEILAEKCPEKIAFLHLDLGNYQSEYDTLEYLFNKNKFSAGAMILLQSFGFAHYGIHKISEAPFIIERNLKILELPTGQGLLLV